MDSELSIALLNMRYLERKKGQFELTNQPLALLIVCTKRK
jgi:hypothetical protein